MLVAPIEEEEQRLIRIPCFPEEMIQPIVHLIEPHHVLRSVRMSRLMPTQPELYASVLDHYRGRRRMTDAENALPYGICFAGSDLIFITNGHHRWYVCQERGRKSMRMWVHVHPLPLVEALLGCHPTPSARPKKKRSTAVSPYHQLQLAFA